MVCQNCKSETNGVRLNGKLFCSICGEELSNPISNEIPNEPIAKIINTPNKIETKIDELGAELDALSQLEKIAKTKESISEQNTELSALEAAESLVDKLNIDSDSKAKKSNAPLPEKTGDNIQAAIEKKNRPHLKHQQSIDSNLTSTQEPVGSAQSEKEQQDSTTQKNKNIETKNTIEKEPQITSKENEPKEALTVKVPEEEPKTEVNSPVIFTPESLQNQIEVASDNVVDEVTKDVNISDQKNDPSVINLIQPEKGYCVKCKSMRGIANQTKVLMKNGHPALKGNCDVCGTTIFKILKGGTREGYQIKHHAAENHKNQTKNNVLTGFFKESVSQATKKPQPNKSDIQKKHRFSFKIFLAITIPIILLLGFVALVFYVNNVAINPEKSKIKAEKAVTFSYLKPGYLPPGYTLSPDTNATVDNITYSYRLLTILPNGKESVSDEFDIIISKKDLTEDSLKSMILAKGKNYQEEKFSNSNIWIIDDKIIIIYDNGILYEINSSGKISKGELEKIAKDIIE